MDVAEIALGAARRRCAGLPGVRIERLRIPGEWPEDVFDLIVLSEVLYFLDAADIARAARRVTASLRPGGLALLVNWTGPTDTPRTGDEAAELFQGAATPALRSLLHVTGSAYRLEVLTPTSAGGRVQA